MDINHIAIDQNHIELIYGLIISHKPKTILELGIGSGFLTKRMIEAFKYNEYQVDIDCVDNFFDWHGKIPEHIAKLQDINLIVQSEKAFLDSSSKAYDFIVSDADHFNCHKWIELTHSKLNNDGILVYHDITNPSFPNLMSIKMYYDTVPHQFSSMLFSKNSKQGERCDRGLLVLQKRQS